MQVRGGRIEMNWFKSLWGGAANLGRSDNETIQQRIRRHVERRGGTPAVWCAPDQFCSRCRARNQLRLADAGSGQKWRENARKFSRDRRLRRDVGIPRSTTSTRSMIAIRISARDASGLTSITPYWRYRSTALAVTGRQE